MMNDTQNNQGIFLTNRQLGWIFSGFLLSGFFIFVAGYFLGQKRAIEKFSQKIEQESLTDQVYSSMCALYDSEELTTDTENEATSDEALTSNNQSHSSDENLVSDADPKKVQEPVDYATAQRSEGTTYYAQLIGFGTQKAADNFVKKLERKGIQAKVHTRQSKSARGKNYYWYQVVTELYDNKNELEIVVNCIKNDEKIHDVRIVTC